MAAAKTTKPPKFGQINICLDGRVVDSAYLPSFATVDLPNPDDGLVVIDTTVGTMVRGNGTAWVSLGGGAVTLAGDVTGTNAAAVVAKASAAFALTGVITISIAGSLNDWAPAGLSGASTIYLSATSYTYQITGLTGGSTGRQITIINTGATYGIRFKAASASSAAANRFGFSDDVYLPIGGSIVLSYDATASLWRLAARGGALTAADIAGGVDFGSEYYGYQSGPRTTPTGGSHNTAFGFQAGPAFTSPTQCTLLGSLAGTNMTGPSSVIAIGYSVAAGIIGNCQSSTIIGNFAAATKAAFSQDVMIGDNAGGAQLGNNNANGNGVYIGYSAGFGNGSATANPDKNVAIGFQAMFAMNGARFCTAVGANALDALTSTTTARMTALGYQAGHSAVTGTDCIFLGYAAGDSSASSAVNRLIAGGSVSPILDVFIGKGETHATPTAITYHATGGSGTNITGGDFVIATGIGTGTGLGGSFRVKVAAAGSTGAAANTLADALTIDSTGKVSAVLGDVAIATLGKGLTVKSGAGGKIGQATLAAGTVTVTNANITANSRIMLTVSTPGGTQGFLSTSKSAGVSFTITSTSATETSVVDYHIIEST